VGGGNGEWEPALKTITDIMKMINVKEYSQPVVSHNTDNIPATNDENAVKTLLETSEFLNK